MVGVYIDGAEAYGLLPTAPARILLNYHITCTLFVFRKDIPTCSCLLIRGACYALTCICIHGRIRDGP